MGTLPSIAGTPIGGTISSGKIVSKTYEIRGNRLGGFIDGVDAVKQAVYKILQTERYEHLIYSRNYGVEMGSVIGKNRDFIESNLEIIISDAVLTDPRVRSITDFETSYSGETLTVTFRVLSIYGDFDIGINLIV